MKSIASILSTIAVLFISLKCEAFSPMTLTSQQQITPTSTTQLGLFGLFQSPEEKEKARLRKEAEIEEQERQLALMRERRTNPEKMEEYEVEVVKRRAIMKNKQRDWEKDEVGNAGFVDEKKQ